VLVVVAVVDDAPECGGSENRHDAVRVSSPQLIHSQVLASESERPWRRGGHQTQRRRGSGLLRRCSGASWTTRSQSAPIALW